MSDERILTCVYCGMEYPQNTPAWGINEQVLTNHIKICEKHPMRKLEVNYLKVREALVAIVGVDSIEELRQMEKNLISLAPMTSVVKLASLKGIRALIDTQEVK
jgi:hypothetical protein